MRDDRDYDRRDYDRDLDHDRDHDLGARGDEDTMRGKMNQAGGKIQEGLGKMTGDRSMEGKGKMKQAKGNIQEGAGDVERSTDDLLDR